MDDHTKEVAARSGLTEAACKELLDAGWMYLFADGEPSVWVAPTADIPDYVPHKEPNCDNSCGNMAPHRHGFPCFMDCPTCQAVCHPSCPAYKET